MAWAGTHDNILRHSYLIIPYEYVMHVMGPSQLRARVMLACTPAQQGAPDACAAACECSACPSIRHPACAEVGSLPCSLGAALGPLLTSYLSQREGGFDNVFYMLYASSLAAAVLLSRLVFNEVTFTYMSLHVWSQIYIEVLTRLCRQHLRWNGLEVVR